MALAALAVVCVLAAGQGARAQQATSYVQIEAQPTRAEAEVRARAYAGAFAEVNGFRLASGWWAIALGPFAREVAAARLAELRRERLIPPDSFLAEERSYGPRFWPPAEPAPATPGGTAAAGDAAPGTAGGDRPPEVASAAPGTAAPAPAPAPAPAAAAQADETVAEARRSEAALSRAEREALQVALQWKGFYGAAVDGAFGSGTRAAMSAWQADRGYEPTGVLTGRQRAELLAGYEAEIAALGLETVRDEPTGIAATLPLALVEFAGYAPPYARFEPRDGSGLRIRLLSQTGGGPALAALYAAVAASPSMPPDGPRALGPTSFTIRGIGPAGESLAYAETRGGLIKGYLVDWDGRATARMPRVLDALRAGFQPFGTHALDPGHGTPLAVDRTALMAGVEPAAPLRARSGVFVDAAGAVLTTAEAVAGCGRIMLDAAYPADVVHRDAARGLAVLRPQAPLSPRGVASLRAEAPALPVAVAVAGFSWGEVLPRPVLTFGRIAAAGGLDGAEGRARLDLAALAGDAGGPVLDAGGAVVGILLTAGGEQDGRLLPAGVAEAADAAAAATVMAAAGLAPRPPETAGALAADELARVADRMTVLVTCWP
jgi:peptidoglycan hydrolase-like protein with peptidoglycan-binding domain